MKRLLILLFLSILFSVNFSQNINEIKLTHEESDSVMAERQELTVQQQEQLKNLSQEKIHIMTDAELYAPGDTVWMRIWLQDGETLKPTDTGSQFVYVDLYSKTDERLSRVKIKKRDDKFCGYLILPKTLISGDYTLCAYTLFISRFAPEFLFRKNIHVISERDKQIGFKARPLVEGYLPHAEPLEVVGTKVYSTHPADTLSVVNLEVPHNTWLSISVTDDKVSPIDTTVSLVNMLLNIPSNARLGNQSKDSIGTNYALAKEQQDFVYGRIIKPNNEQFEIYLINLKTGILYRTFSNPSDGTFMFADVDTPEGSIFDIAIYYKGKDTIHEIDLFSITLPDLISHLPSDAKQYYVNELIEKIKNKETIKDETLGNELKMLISNTLQSDSTQSAKMVEEDFFDKFVRRKNDLNEIVRRPFYVDDSYTLHASKSIYSNKFLQGASNQNIIYVMSEFPRVSVIDSIPMYPDETGKLIPIRIVVGEKEIPLQVNSEGKILPLLETFMPCGFVYALDFISKQDAQKYFPSKRFPNSPIIRIDIFKITDTNRIYGYQRILSFEKLGYQPSMIHNNLKVRPDIVHTRYWNPAIYTAERDLIRLELPLPTDRRSTYTLRAEGISSDGELVSIIRRISL